MLLVVTDGNGVSQTVVVQGQGPATDASGEISVTGTAQPVCGADATRSGFLLQNNGTHPMTVNDLGLASLEPQSFTVAPGATWPPMGYPVPIGSVSVAGTAADNYAARTW